MNSNQKKLTIGALVLLCVTLLFAPWELSVHVGNQSAYREEYSPIWMPPTEVRLRARLRIQTLAVEWLGIAILYGGIWALLCDGKAGSET
jgi:hypothetical protein